MAGLAWVQGFLRRNPMIASRKAQNLSTRRAQKLKRFIVIGHFSKLTTALEESGLMDKPERIYNVDDKRCRSYLHKHPLLLTPQKAEITLTWLLLNMGKMSPYCLLKMPLDQPYDQLYSFKDKECLENGVMHYLQDL
jgi:hypothetical protein